MVGAIMVDGHCLCVCLLPDPKSRTEGHKKLENGRKEAHDAGDL